MLKPGQCRIVELPPDHNMVEGTAMLPDGVATTVVIYRPVGKKVLGGTILMFEDDLLKNPDKLAKLWLYRIQSCIDSMDSVAKEEGYESPKENAS